MTKAKLITPCPEYLASYLDACYEFQREGGVRSVHDPDRYEEWKESLFAVLEDQRLGRNLKPGYVPASAFWLVEDGAFVGVGSLRHCLTPALERYGGHIGYAVRPSRRSMGYGTLQLKFLLREALALGIERVLVTCDEDNRASARVMEKNGGIYQDTVDNEIDGHPVRTKRYWIDTREG